MSARSRGPGNAPQSRRDRLIQEREHDVYKVREKLPDPTACTDCGAMFRGGRWVWGSPPVDAHRAVCPACRRTRDDYPAGFVTLTGSFLASHRDEVLALARNVEEREKQDHPLKRIMETRDEQGDLLITTTDPKLARSIGDAVHRAYQGELEYQYPEGEAAIRVRWRR